MHLKVIGFKGGGGLRSKVKNVANLEAIKLYLTHLHAITDRVCFDYALGLFMYWLAGHDEDTFFHHFMKYYGSLPIGVMGVWVLGFPLQTMAWRPSTSN